MFSTISSNMTSVVCTPVNDQVKILFRLSELDCDISMLSLHTVIGLSLDIISKCLNILSKPTEPKVSSASQ